MKTEGTRAKALKEARHLLQVFGFNGFSFQHIADAVGIKKPSLYDHFESKEDLAREVVKDYRANFEEWTKTIEAFEPKAQIGALFENFRLFAEKGGRICPFSAIAGDFNSLPASVKKSVDQMGRLQLDWLEGVIKKGQKEKVFRGDRPSRDLALAVFSMGLGAQLIARGIREIDTIRQMKEQAFKLLEEK